jgi:hypothetical protein
LVYFIRHILVKVYNEATNFESEDMNMNISFEKRVALVTGAASGLGLATAVALQKQALPWC